MTEVVTTALSAGRRVGWATSGALMSSAVRLQNRIDCAGEDGERGDIPGWVLITIMTAGLVTAVWSVADGQLRSILTNALDSVRHP